MSLRPLTITEALREGDTKETLREVVVIASANGTADVLPVGSNAVLYARPISGGVVLDEGDTAFLIGGMVIPKYVQYQAVVGSISDSASGGGSSPSQESLDAFIAETHAWESSHLAAADPHPVYLTSSEANGLYVPLTRQVIAGSGLTGGGNLYSDITFNIGAGAGISVAADSVSISLGANSGMNLAGNTLQIGAGAGISVGSTVGVALGSPSGMNLTGNTLQIDDSIAGAGLGISAKVMTVNAAYGLVISGDNVIVNLSYPFEWAETHTWANGKAVKSTSFTSGFTGNGWRAWYNTGLSTTEMETDNLWVRGTLNVYELLIQQIRATNGSIFVTAAAKLDSATLNSGVSYNCVTEGKTSDYSPFAVGDVLRAQRVAIQSSGGSGAVVWRSDLVVTAINVGGNQRTFTADLIGGSTAPAAGMDFVRLGSTSNVARRGSVYMTADDSGAPFVDVVDGITSHAGWNQAGNVKMRIGKLDGLSLIGSYTNEYGLWFGNGTASTSSYLRASGSVLELRNMPMKLYNSTDQTVDLTSSGRLRLGTNISAAGTTLLDINPATSSLVIGSATNPTWTTIYGVVSIQSGSSGWANLSGLSSAVTTAGTTATWSGISSIPAPLGAVSAAGLYLSSAVVGFWDGTYWRSYIGSAGDFLLRGAPIANVGVIHWNPSTYRLAGGYYSGAGFTGYSEQWYTDANTGAIMAGGGKVMFSATGLTIASPQTAGMLSPGNPAVIEWHESIVTGSLKGRIYTTVNSVQGDMWIDSAVGTIRMFSRTTIGSTNVIDTGISIGFPDITNMRTGTITVAGKLSISDVTIDGTAGRNFFKDSEKSDGNGLRVGAAWGKYGIYAESGLCAVGGSSGLSIQNTTWMDTGGNLFMCEKNVYLRGTVAASGSSTTSDSNHGLGWYGPGRLWAGIDPDGPILFGFSGGALGTSNGTLALRWEKNACVGIARAPIVGGYSRLSVQGGIHLTGAEVNYSMEQRDNSGIQWQTYAVYDGTYGNAYRVWGSGIGDVVRFNTGGGIYNYANNGSWNTVSDARIKIVRGDYTLGLPEIERVRTVEYEFNGQHGTTADGKRRVGIIAQEIREIFPGTVVEGDGDDKILSFNQDELIYALINSVKTLSARIKELE